MVWFTSDTHFGHENVLGFTGRPWEALADMEDALVDGINARVAPSDDLYILGDFSYKTTAEEARRVRRRVACRRVHLVPGNHDKDWSQPEVAGTFVVEPPVCQLKLGGRRLVLCHYPLEDWPHMSHGAVHLHGHIHSQGSDYNELNRMQGIYRYDVGVDANGYAPVSLEAVLAWFEGVACAGRSDWRRWAVSTDSEEARAYSEALVEERRAEQAAEEGEERPARQDGQAAG